MNKSEWLKISSVDEAIAKLAAPTSPAGIAGLAALGAGVGGLGTLGLQALKGDEDEHPTTRYGFPAAQGALLGGATGAAAGYLAPSLGRYVDRVMRKEEPQQPEIKYDFSNAPPEVMAELEKQKNLSQYKPFGGWGMDSLRRGWQDPMFAGAPLAVGGNVGAAVGAGLNAPTLGFGRTAYEDFSDPVAARRGMDFINNAERNGTDWGALNRLLDQRAFEIARQGQFPGPDNVDDLLDARRLSPDVFDDVLKDKEVSRFLSRKGMPWTGPKEGPLGERSMAPSLRAQGWNVLDKALNRGRSQAPVMKPWTNRRAAGRGIAGILATLLGAGAGAAVGNGLTNSVSPFGAQARFDAAARPYQK